MKTDLRDLFPETEGLDDKSVNALLKAIKNSYEEDHFDYLKFKKSVGTLVKMDMSEEMAVKSAFATASTLGLTKDSLISSAKKYVYALENERESFAQAVLTQRSNQIDGRKAEVEQLAQKIKDHKKKILELEREIEIFQSRIDNVDNDVEEARIKIESTKEKFLKVYDIIESNINKDIERIQLYL